MKVNSRKRTIIGALLLSLVFLLSGWSPATAQTDSVGAKIMAHVAEVKKEIPAESIEQLQEMMTEGGDFHIIDVREADEYQAGHIKGAELFPRGTIEFDAAKGKLGPTGDKYLLYCKRDPRSALAAKALKDIGYDNVYYITGGFEAWINAGNPVFNQHGEVTVKEFEKAETDSE